MSYISRISLNGNYYELFPRLTQYTLWRTNYSTSGGEYSDQTVVGVVYSIGRLRILSYCFKIRNWPVTSEDLTYDIAQSQYLPDDLPKIDRVTYQATAMRRTTDEEPFTVPMWWDGGKSIRIRGRNDLNNREFTGVIIGVVTS